MKSTIALIVALAVPALPATAAASVGSVAAGACSSSAVLNAVADALTTGNDGTVLRVALAGERRLTVCGNERDAIAAQLIAADAYGDTNQPAARCSALRHAAARASRIDDTTRARALAHISSGCRS